MTTKPTEGATEARKSPGDPRWSTGDLLAEMDAADEKKPAAAGEDEGAASDEDEDEDAAPAAQAPAPTKPKPKIDEKDEDGEEEGDDGLDPKTRKNLLAIQRQERRTREQLSRDRQALETEKKEWAERVEEVKRLQGVIGSARTRIDDVIGMLKLAPEDIEPFARAVYQRSPQAAEAAKKNPAARAQADKALAEREQSAEVKQLREEIQAMKDEKVKAAEAAAADRAAVEYLDAVSRVAVAGKFRDPSTGDVTRIDAPLAREFLEKTPKKARRIMAEIALELGRDLPDPPDFVEVLEELEKRRREDLEDAGVDVDARIASLRTGKAKTDDEDKKPDKKRRTDADKPSGEKSKLKGRKATDAEWDELKAEAAKL